MKTVFVTGATGFVGYHLVKKLLRNGNSVHLLVRPESPFERLSALPQDFHLHVHDGSTSMMLEIFQKARPDAVFHLASKSSYAHTPQDLTPLIHSNILLGTQLLEASVKTGVRIFINTGTYWQHYQGRSYDPVCLYAATKQAFEDIVAFYTRCLPLRALTLKLFDVYGPNDSRMKLLSILKHAANNGEVLPMSPGDQLLDLVYVDDVVRAYLQAWGLLTRNDAGVLEESYAVSSGKHISLKDVVSLFESIAGKKVYVRWGGRPYRQREVMVPWKGKILPGWKAEVSIAKGMAMTLAEKENGNE
jgi:nucleoside-diphosphate-sugar epimerase